MKKNKPLKLYDFNIICLFHLLPFFPNSSCVFGWTLQFKISRPEAGKNVKIKNLGFVELVKTQFGGCPSVLTNTYFIYFFPNSQTKHYAHFSSFSFFRHSLVPFHVIVFLSLLKCSINPLYINTCNTMHCS